MEDWADTVVNHLDFIRKYLWNWSPKAMLHLGADDLVQEVAMHLLIKGAPRDQSQLHNYFAVVAKRVAISAERRRACRPQESELGEFDRLDSSERAHWEQQLMQTLQQLAEMPDRRAAKAILLCAVGFTIEESAEILSVGTATVKSDHKTAREYLGKAA
jgi:RNA polymerase sigma factor (sigma-70 family)